MTTQTLPQTLPLPEGIDPEAMRQAAAEAGEFLKMLGNPHRLMILCALSSGEKSVGQLAAFLGIRDSTVSQHLALLRRDRIIAGRRAGQVIWYRIESEPARRVMAVLYESFCA
ncbi:ArsR/SmtB family transcription factor [Paracoccus aminovorans]|uniref:ArsR/SmtB family transcription factor n=1 Tax=Paracoccus aminovorans TaxID=34004 RepID=UPI0007814166|nr:metalloregulator ArsR/SmtB family transcription factor [Paracoccus aminovorans]MDQ7775524.1 metalloregulator ArsR/SmtB family transcription factor [Paracoccus aminovorans]